MAFTEWSADNVDHKIRASSGKRSLQAMRNYMLYHLYKHSFIVNMHKNRQS